MSQACQKPGNLTCDLGAKKKSTKNGFLASLKCGRSGPVLSCGNAAGDLLAGRSGVGQDSNLARKRSATQGLTMCIDKPRDDFRVSSSPDSVADTAEMPPKPRNHRRRRRRPKPPRSAPITDAAKSATAVPPAATSICIARSPTNKDFIFRVDASAPVSVKDAKKGPAEAQSAAACSPPYVNSATAFILGGNEDLSDTASDWDDVDGDAEDASDFSLDLLVMPLLTNFLSVSVLGSCPMVQRRLVDQVDGHQPLSPLARDANDRWNRTYHGSIDKAQRTPAKVKFPAGDGLVEVHRADDVERKGPWEQIALDRRRFQSRISSAESVLAPVLSPEHRQKIYQKIHTTD